MSGVGQGADRSGNVGRDWIRELLHSEQCTSDAGALLSSLKCVYI